MIIAKLGRENRALKQSSNANPTTSVNKDNDIGEAINSALDQLRTQFEEKEAKLSTLEDLHSQQKTSIEMWQHDKDDDSYKQLLEQHEQSEALIKQLQKDIEESCHTIAALENQLADSDYQSARISILEESEKRLKKQVDSSATTDEQMAQLSEGLKKAKSKNLTLSRENWKLKENIKKLSKASDKQRALIEKITGQLEKASQLEEYQSQTIAELKKKLKEEKANGGESDKAQELEQELKEIQDKFERTLREKEFIESYLIEMDKILENEQEAEKAIDGSGAKISAIEKTYPDFEVEVEETTSSKETARSAEDPLPKLEINETNYPELTEIVKHNRLFGIINEYWHAQETPPMHLVSEDNITRPNTLSHWVITPLSNNRLAIVIGIHHELGEILQKVTAAQSADNDISLEDTLVLMGQKTASTFVEDIDGDYKPGTSSYQEKKLMDATLLNASVASEALQEAKDQPFYTALIQMAED